MQLTSESSFTLGKIDVTKFRNKTETEATLRWTSVPTKTNRYAWTAEMKNIFYNDKSVDDGFRNTAVFDSFYGGVHLPLSEWTPTIESIKRDLNSQRKNYLECDMNVTYNCTWRGKCSTYKADWKKFSFNFIDDRAYEVSPDAYLQEIARDGTTYC